MKPTKYILILLSLFLTFSCEDDDNPTSQGSEIEVDWVLIKNSEFLENIYYPDEMGNYGDLNVEGVGYFFWYTKSTEIQSLSLPIIDNDNMNSNITSENFNGILSFTYNNQDYSYDLSSSYIEEYDVYLIVTGDDEEQYTRITVNLNENNSTIYSDWGVGYLINLLSPNELIDYR